MLSSTIGQRGRADTPTAGGNGDTRYLAPQPTVAAETATRGLVIHSATDMLAVAG